MPSEAPIITGDDLGPTEQSVRYELTTLHFRLPATEKALAGIEPWVRAPEAHGEFLGCWLGEHGPLGRAYVLRSFDDDDALYRERERAAASDHPFGAGEHLSDLTMCGFAPFPFVPRARPGEFGSVYEIRDYHLVPGGLPATIAGWRHQLPVRHSIDPVTVVMYALDGPARIVHIWPFAGLDERVAVRKRLSANAQWPPPGGPEKILEADSIMAWPARFSPLR
ncbi:NIPSNAP family protein [Amycolatopsis pithecellobii]|uniref:NIPSNAP family protein n=1 Tax=Amycolatopsis pithecellobii TaxID=664692 RepID=A0A6N7YZB1_9PSEU|nr:NIPSNAP family protein [Amycolatopsis pithecellobii]MTD52404.1 NIPSNAP family protein [Amycolatopsis pithecellobii]